LARSSSDGHREYLAARIDDAQFFDINAVCDTSSPYPHMVPSAEQFAMQITELGINNDDFVVAYDGAGIFASPRAWWMFKVRDGSPSTKSNPSSKPWSTHDQESTATPLHLLLSLAVLDSTLDMTQSLCWMEDCLAFDPSSPS